MMESSSKIRPLAACLRWCSRSPRSGRTTRRSCRSPRAYACKEFPYRVFLPAALPSSEADTRRGDRVRWTRNDKDLGLVNSQTAEVSIVKEGRVGFRLEDGRTLDLTAGDPQLRHVDRAWASTVHAFQGRTVDTVIAAMEANHPNLTNQKTLYVEISRARDRAELVTDDAKALRERLEAVTGERIAALEAIAPEKAPEAGPDVTRNLDREGFARESRGRTPGTEKGSASRGIGM